MNLDEIVYGNPNQVQLKWLSKHSYLDGLFSELTSFTFPHNSSEATREELNSIIKKIDELKIDTEVQKRYLSYDKQLVVYLTSLLLTDEAEMQKIKGIVTSILNDTNPLLYKLKFFFQRPRPSQLATYYKLKLFPFESFSANSPSYPSGHAYTAKIICEVLGNKYPQLYSFFEQMIQDICYSRIYMGLHFQTDIDVGIYAAEKVLDNQEFKIKYGL